MPDTTTAIVDENVAEAMNAPGSPMVCEEHGRLFRQCTECEYRLFRKGAGKAFAFLEDELKQTRRQADEARADTAAVVALVRAEYAYARSPSPRLAAAMRDARLAAFPAIYRHACAARSANPKGSEE